MPHTYASLVFFFSKKNQVYDVYAVGLICLRLTFAPLWDGDAFTAFLQLLRAGFFFSFRFFWFFFCFFCSKEKEPEEANSGFFFFFAAVWDRKNVFSQLWNVFSFLFFFCRCGTERTCSLTEEGVLLLKRVFSY